MRLHSSWNLNVSPDIDLDLYIDQKCPLDKGNVLLLCEPREVTKELHAWTLENGEAIGMVLTHDEILLSKLRNAVTMEYGTSWMANRELKDKRPGFTTVIGGKRNTAGHNLRWELWSRKDEVKSLEFWSGIKGPDTGLVVGEYKDNVLSTMFHVCIENTVHPIYFTEKLLDAFMVMSVPIYLGATNIHAYFNKDGMITCNSIEEIITAVNTLGPDDYNRMLPHLRYNRERAMYWANLAGRVSAKLKGFQSNPGIFQ